MSVSQPVMPTDANMLDMLTALQARIARVEQMVVQNTGRLSIAATIAQTAALFDVEPTKLVGEARDARIVRARDALCFVLNVVGGASLAKIGRHLGNRNHTTIRSACMRAIALRAKDADFFRKTETLRLQLINDQFNQGQAHG